MTTDMHDAHNCGDGFNGWRKYEDMKFPTACNYFKYDGTFVHGPKHRQAAEKRPSGERTA